MATFFKTDLAFCFRISAISAYFSLNRTMNLPFISICLSIHSLRILVHIILFIVLDINIFTSTLIDKIRQSQNNSGSDSNIENNEIFSCVLIDKKYSDNRIMREFQIQI